MIISPPEKTFRQTLALRLVALAAPALAWTIAMIIWTDQPGPEPISLGIAILSTILWVVLWVAVGRAELTTHQEGVRRQTVFGTTEIRWEEVSETRFTQVPVGQHVGAHFGLLGWLVVAASGNRGTSNQKTLVLKAEDGRKLKITPNWRDSEEAMRISLTRVNPHIREELWRRIQGGDTVKFGNVSLSQRGVGWKDKEPLPFNTLAKYKIDGANLRIKSEGKWLDNISVNTGKVPNVFVLLDLIDELRSGGKTSAPDPLARAAGG